MWLAEPTHLAVPSGDALQGLAAGTIGADAANLGVVAAHGAVIEMRGPPGCCCRLEPLILGIGMKPVLAADLLGLWKGGKVIAATEVFGEELLKSGKHGVER